MLISKILNSLHLLLIFFPITIFFVSKKLVRSWFKYIVLIILLTPIHWRFLDGECILTIIARKLGAFKETNTTSGFSETYFRWWMEPLMKHVFNWKWNNDGIGKMVHILWGFNFILIWYYIFFIYC